jgi:hypothetical protein
LPLNATGETARALFAHQPELTGLVLVDDEGHPLLLLDRDRFMLAISAAFGHALYARRPAAGLADRPRTLDLQTSVIDAVDRVAATSPQHIYDDIVLIDHQGRCQGVLRVRDLVRDLAHRQDRPPQHPRETTPGRSCVASPADASTPGTAADRASVPQPRTSTN